MLLTKSGVLSFTGPSAPFSTISIVSLRSPALARTSLNRTPAHAALPMAPGPTAHRVRGDREAAAIPWALPNGRDLALLKTALQVLHRQLGRVRRTVPADLQPPIPQLDLLRDAGEMVAHKECIIRGHW